MAGLDGRLAEILESVADGVTVLDRSGTVRYANDTAAGLMGRERAEDVIGRSGAELSDGFELLTTAGEPFDPVRMPTRRALAGEEDVEEMIRFRLRGSTEDRWSLVRARLLRGASPDQDLVVTAFQDVTSLKRSESRLSFLSEASAILGESADYQETLSRVASITVPQLADWCVVDVVEEPQGISRIAVAHTDPEKVALADEVRRRWPPDPDQPGGVQDILRTRQSLHVPEVTEEMLRTAARDEEHLELLRKLGMRSVLIVPLLARGEALGALTLVQAESGRAIEEEDIALVEELGRRAGAAIDAARLLWAARETGRLRDEFVAVASHDMRTPLAAVRGYAQLARRHIAKGEAEVAKLDGWLADIESVVARLNDLVAELMDVSLIHGGRAVPLDTVETDLSALTVQLVERRRELSEAHDFVIETNGQSARGLWDPARLMRVLDNLLDNAVKFSPGGGEIRVSVGTRDGSAHVSIADHGIGISPGDLGLIFSPTYRGRNARGTIGTGLGLAGSRRLVEQMGGNVLVESKRGQGSTFTVWLPLRPPSANGA